MKPEYNFSQMREEMLQHDLIARDITDTAVLKAMAKVQREKFVPIIDLDEAYADSPLPIECGQTISQPYIVAYMTQALEIKPGNKILEIGTGSGFQAAILLETGGEVFSIERHPQLATHAEQTLKECGYINNLHLKMGDGSLGWPEHAPYDRIILTCCAPNIVTELLAQLNDNGILIAPVQKSSGQILQKITKKSSEFITENLLPVIFVKLIGEKGFKE